MREKDGEENSWDIIVIRLSFDYTLANDYCPSAIACHFMAQTDILENVHTGR